MTLRATYLNLREGLSLAGRLVGIVLLVLMADFAVNSLMFERENAYVLNSEEIERLAERLVVARRVIEPHTPAERAEAARQVSTARLQIGWQAKQPQPDPTPRGGALRAQMVAAERELAGADLRVRLVPRDEGDGVQGTLALKDGSTVAFRSSDLVSSKFNWSLLVRFSAPSLLLLALAWWAVRRSFRPLDGLVAAAAQVGTDDLDPLPEAGQREVRQLIRAFNRMHERISQLLDNRTQTLLAIGHDLRTPLARLQLRLDGARIDEPTRADMAGDIAEMGDLLGSLQTYVDSGRETGPAEAMDLASMAQTLVDDATDSGQDAVYSGPDRLEIRAHPLSVRRALANLVQNALRYGGSAEVSLKREGAMAELQVADRGPGIPEDRLAEALQPFSRLDEARARNTRGMGLGLAIVDRIVAAEGGQFWLANRTDGGLVATVLLPLVPPNAAHNTRHTS